MTKSEEFSPAQRRAKGCESSPAKRELPGECAVPQVGRPALIVLRASELHKEGSRQR
jgi:hypothetical protein